MSTVIKKESFDFQPDPRGRRGSSGNIETRKSENRQTVFVLLLQFFFLLDFREQ